MGAEYLFTVKYTENTKNIVKSFHLFTEKPPNKSSMRIVVDAESRKRTIGAGDGGVPTKKTWFDK